MATEHAFFSIFQQWCRTEYAKRDKMNSKSHIGLVCTTRALKSIVPRRNGEWINRMGHQKFSAPSCTEVAAGHW